LLDQSNVGDMATNEKKIEDTMPGYGYGDSRSTNFRRMLAVDITNLRCK